MRHSCAVEFDPGESADGLAGLPLKPIVRSRARHDSQYATATLLSKLRESLLSNPGQLRAAQKCMQHVGSIAKSGGANWWWDGRETPTDLEVEDLPWYFESLFKSQRAQQSVSERVKLRVIWAARQAGLPQREIAALVEEPQTQVFRKLRSLEEDPSLLALTPRELNDRFKAGQFDRQVLLEMLAAYPYVAGEFPEEEPVWGYVPGAWDELAELAIEGEISDDELDLVIAASRSLAALSG